MKSIYTWKPIHLYLKILDLANIFVADAPIKKNKKFSCTPLSEHFEIWVWKPAMSSRVNESGQFRVVLRSRIRIFFPDPLHFVLVRITSGKIFGLQFFLEWHFETFPKQIFTCLIEPKVGSETAFFSKVGSGLIFFHRVGFENCWKVMSDTYCSAGQQYCRYIKWYIAPGPASTLLSYCTRRVQIIFTREERSKY